MLFATNRKVNKKASSIEFDVDGSDRGNVGLEMYFCETDGKTHKEIGSVPFFERLSKSKNKNVMTMLHGYNVPPANAIKAHMEFGEMQPQIDIVSLIWPSWVGTRWYSDDQKQADLSGIAFSKFWSKLHHWNKSNNLNKILHSFSHSMGNRVNRESLLAVEKYEELKLPSNMFATSFMAAADVPHDSMEDGHPGSIVARVSKNVVIYHAEDDRALNASSYINWMDRLGEMGPRKMSIVPDNVYAINCDRINEGHQNDRHWFDDSIGHSYYLKGDKGYASECHIHISDTIFNGKPKAGADRKLTL